MTRARCSDNSSSKSGYSASTVPDFKLSLYTSISASQPIPRLSRSLSLCPLYLCPDQLRHHFDLETGTKSGKNPSSTEGRQSGKHSLIWEGLLEAHVKTVRKRRLPQLIKHFYQYPLHVNYAFIFPCPDSEYLCNNMAKHLRKNLVVAFIGKQGSNGQSNFVSSAYLSF